MPDALFQRKHKLDKCHVWPHDSGMAISPSEAWDEIRPMLNFSELARKLGISRAAVSAWDYVPEDRVEEVSEYTHIPPEKIRPDKFPGPMPWQMDA